MPACALPVRSAAAVLYDAGVDPHEDDALGRLSLTDDGLRRRELLVSGAWECTGAFAVATCRPALAAARAAT